MRSHAWIYSSRFEWQFWSLTTQNWLFRSTLCFHDYCCRSRSLKWVTWLLKPLERQQCIWRSNSHTTHKHTLQKTKNTFNIYHPFLGSCNSTWQWRLSCWTSLSHETCPYPRVHYGLSIIVPKKPWVSNYILVTLEVYHQYIIKPLKLWVLIMPNTPQQPSGYQGYKITIHYHG
jgi:hypothetical protein